MRMNIIIDSQNGTTVVWTSKWLFVVISIDFMQMIFIIIYGSSRRGRLPRGGGLAENG